MLLPLVAVSGEECVDALRLAGFDVRSRSDIGTTMAKDVRVVFVPDVAMLPPDELQAVMRDAGLAYSDFLDLLSEAPTDPDMRWSARAASTASPR